MTSKQKTLSPFILDDKVMFSIDKQQNKLLIIIAYWDHLLQNMNFQISRMFDFMHL